MGWCKDELEAVWNGREVSFRFFGNVGGMIIKDHSNLYIWSIEGIKFLKKISELCTAMPVLNISMNMARNKINGGQKGNNAVSFIFIIPSDGRVSSRNGWKVRGHILDRIHQPSYIRLQQTDMFRHQQEAHDLATSIACIQISSYTLPGMNRRPGYISRSKLWRNCLPCPAELCINKHYGMQCRTRIIGREGTRWQINRHSVRLLNLKDVN